MITIQMEYEGKNGSALLFAKEMLEQGVVAEIRKEPGNLRYEYFLPLEGGEKVLLLDSWIDQQALDAHHASPMMEKIAQLREKYDLHMKVERFVSDGDGIPQKDQAFIRP